jgi:hypothetical protein
LDDQVVIVVVRAIFGKFCMVVIVVVQKIFGRDRGRAKNLWSSNPAYKH